MATSLQAQFRRRPYYKDLSIGHLKRHDAAIAIVAALLLMSCACHLTNEVTAERIVPERSVPAQGMEPGYKKSRSNARGNHQSASARLRHLVRGTGRFQRCRRYRGHDHIL